MTSVGVLLLLLYELPNTLALDDSDFHQKMKVCKLCLAFASQTVRPFPML